MDKFTGMKSRVWLFFNIGWTILYLLWRIFFTVPTEYGWISITVGISLLIVEVLGMFEAFIHYFNMYKIENIEIPKVLPEEYPDVDVFIATYNEPLSILEKTVNGCVHMDYPDKNKVHIYLCDDGRRKEVKELANQMGIGYITREDNKDAKAGNLNHAMSLTSSPLIATFDADMIPQCSFLIDTAAYFVDQEVKNRELEENARIHLGFVQTPQSFYNPDLFQFNLFAETRIPNEQDYFYKDIQISRNKSNSVIYGGSNTLISRKALDDVGGFYAKSVTEDFATGILIQKKGYVCYAINKVLASGLSATDLKSLINQRVRWARGCIATGRRLNLLFTNKLTLMQKANYIASIWYWYASWKRLIYIMSPILFAVFGIMVVKCTLVEVLIFWLPMYISSNITLKMLSRNIRNTRLTNVYETTLFVFMLIPVLLETFGITMKKFKVTKKEKSRRGNKINPLYALPYVVLILLSVMGIVKCVMWMFHTGRIDYMVILFWLVANLFNLVMSLFFIMGREMVRDYERAAVKAVCEISDHYRKAAGYTKDISENGVSVILDNPIDLDETDQTTLVLMTERYRAEVKGEIVLVDKVGAQWKYAFAITDFCESKAQYLQIIYDREPTLPATLKESTGTFDDLRLNIVKRLTKEDYQNRKRARVPVNVLVNTSTGDQVRLINFNYEYMLASVSDEMPSGFYLELEDELHLKCRLERELDGGVKLYHIENYRQIHAEPFLREKLEKWIFAHVEGEKKHVVMTLSNRQKRKLCTDEFSELDYL